MLAKLTSKGQVTIPKLVRERLGIGVDDQVDFVIEDDRVVMVPVRPLKDLRGVVRPKGTGRLDDERKQVREAVADRVANEERCADEGDGVN